MLLDGGGSAPRGLLLLQVPLQSLRDPHLRLVVDLRGKYHYSQMAKTRLANDHRPGRLLDSEIIIDFKILVSEVLRSVLIVPIIGWNQLELGNRVKKSGRDHDRWQLWLRPIAYCYQAQNPGGDFVTEEQLEVARNGAVHQASSRGKADRFVLSSPKKLPPDSVPDCNL